MTQWVKVPVPTPDDLSPVPGTHMVESENWLLQAVLCMQAHFMYANAHTQIRTCVCAHTHAHRANSLTHQLYPFSLKIKWPLLVE